MQVAVSSPVSFLLLLKQLLAPQPSRPHSRREKGEGQGWMVVSVAVGQGEAWASSAELSTPLSTTAPSEPGGCWISASCVQ